MRMCCLRTALFLYLEARGADFLIAVKNCRHKDVQAIREQGDLLALAPSRPRLMRMDPVTASATACR